MTFAALHKSVTYLYAFLGICALALGDQLGPSALGLLLSGLVITWFIEGAIVHRPEYGRLWNAAAGVVFLSQTFRFLALDAAVLTLAVELAGFLQISRLAARRSAAEHRQVAALGFLHLIAATILSTDVEYGVLFFGFVVVTPWMLVLTHVRGEIEAAAASSSLDERDATARARPMLESRGVVGAGFLFGIASLSIPLFLATAGIFLVFPRVGMGFLSFGVEEPQRIAGFGEDVRLGGFGVIRDDPSVVLRITPPRLPVDPPPLARFRLRGTSFDRYDAGRWTRTPDRGRSVPSEHGRFTITHAPQGSGSTRYGLVLNALDEPVLFLPEGTRGVELAPRMVEAAPMARRLVQRRGLDLRYADPDGLDVVYAALVDEASDGIVEPLGADARALYLALPRGQERIAELAGTIARGARTPAEIAERLQAFLRDSGRFRYSLELPDTRGRDPLEVFLFEARAGHCEYYSSAMAVMLRTLGVPARNVTGFVGGEWNRFGRYYAIRNGDAHSWVEAYVGDRWRTYDPTPPLRSAAAARRGPLEELRALADALRVRWASYVVGYDLRAQLGVLRHVFGALGGLRSAGARRDGDALPAGARDASLVVARRMAIGLPALALLGVAVIAFARRRRGGAEEPAAVRLERAVEAGMARLGHPRVPSETPVAWAARLRDAGVPGADVAFAVAEAHAEARYRSRPLDPERVRQLDERVRRLPRRAP